MNKLNDEKIQKENQNMEAQNLNKKKDVLLNQIIPDLNPSID